MHRSYSLRQSRELTTQIQASTPPRSSTKSRRCFGRGSPGLNFRTCAAGAFASELAKRLSQLIEMERTLMRSIELAAYERKEVAKQLAAWGEECENDVSDITDKLGVLIFEVGESEDDFIDYYDQYRLTLKQIRNIQSSVQPSRDRKRKFIDTIAHLKHTEPQSTKIVILEQELVRAEAASLVAEAQLSNITREKIKAGFNYQFDAMREHYEKIALIAGYGTHLLDLIDDTSVTPGEIRSEYSSYDLSKQIIVDCENALSDWTLDTASVKSPLRIEKKQTVQRSDASDDLSQQNTLLERESSL